ncbi:MAG: 2OG-Fe(II) oxygenase family protein [Candidatus Kariarchaeaceae archaeon]|jgi:predicted 2-oxoglutarate/Fe(II)-dependent dioxygenase YbiX
MNIELLKNNYIVVPNFIDPQHAAQLEKEFFVTDEIFDFNGDEQAPKSSAVYDYLPALELLANKTPEVSKLIGETVLPTYVYSRIYRNGSILHRHTDRPGCEISMTLHLGSDKPWAIWIETPEGKNRSVNLNPGDAMLYLGCIAPHWRDEFEGEEYTQFFLHYVRSRGMCSPAYFDKNKFRDINTEELLQEYEQMRNFSNVSDMTILPRKYRQQQQQNEDSSSVEIVQDPVNDTDYIDFDDVVIVNSKYEKFLTKKDTPELINEPKVEEKSKPSGKLSSKSLADFVWYGEEVVDPELCDKILDEYVNTNYWEATLTGSGHDPEARRCEQICISEQSIIAEENSEVRKQLDDQMFEVVQNLIGLYQEAHPEFELEIQEDSGYELLKYEEGDFYIEHTDSFKEQPRALTVIVSMNNAYEGGEVALFNRELVYKLDAGDVIMFPSNFMYPHEIMPVKSGTRFSIITWVV